MTLSNRVGELERRMELRHQELHSGLESLKSEFKSTQAGMMEKLDSLLRARDNHERDRKEKDLTTPLAFADTGIA